MPKWSPEVQLRGEGFFLPYIYNIAKELVDPPHIIYIYIILYMGKFCIPKRGEMEIWQSGAKIVLSISLKRWQTTAKVTLVG